MAIFCAVMSAAVAAFALMFVFVFLWVTIVPGRSLAFSGPLASFNIKQIAAVETTIHCKNTLDDQHCVKSTNTIPPEQIKLGLEDRILMAIGWGSVTLPLIFLAYGLSQACLCFVNFTKGLFLARSSIVKLRNFALNGILFLLLYPIVGRINYIVGSCVEAVFKLFRPKTLLEFHSLGGYTLNVGPLPMVLTAIYAVTLTMITAIMAKAAIMAEDNAQIV